MNIKIKSDDIGKWFKSFSGDIKVQVGNRWIDIDSREGDNEDILKKLNSKVPFEFEYDTSERRLISPDMPYEEPIPEKSVDEWTRERRVELNQIEEERLAQEETITKED